MRHANTLPTNDTSERQRPTKGSVIKQAVAGLALAGAVTGAVLGIKAYNKHEAAEHQQRNAEIERIIDPALDSIGDEMLDAYNKKAGKITMQKNPDGHVQLTAAAADAYSNRKVNVVMGVGKDGKPDPNRTVFAGVSDVIMSGGELISGGRTQLATREGSEYVSLALDRVDDDYEPGDAYAGTAMFAVGDPGYLHDTAYIETASAHIVGDTAPRSAEEVAREAAADTVQQFDENLKTIQQG